VPQLAMAKFFKNGDFRSGYYRDQTFMIIRTCAGIKKNIQTSKKEYPNKSNSG
jgi:hypothetical protein